MSGPRPEKYTQIIQRIVATATPEEKSALATWSDELLSIRDSKESLLEKAKKSIAVTSKSAVIKPAITLISRELTPHELTLLSTELLQIKNSSISNTQKLTRGLALTYRSLKDLAWDNRGLKARLALGGAVVGAVVFGGQGAGIAAPGTAIGVPLWVVFGAGAAFVGSLYEELTGKRRNPTTTHRVIDSKREKSGDA